MESYMIEMNGALVKEYKSLKKALDWVLKKSKNQRDTEYPDSLTIWKIKNRQKECLLSNCF